MFADTGHMDVDQSTWDMSACGITQLTRSSSLKNSFRRSKREPHWIANIRQQLGEQLKCLDQRLDAHLSMLWELQDFYRRRAEVEAEYSRNLDKLVKGILTRHKTEKQRDGWMGYSTYKCWQMLLTSTRRSSQDHAILAELFSVQMFNRLQDLMDDTQRMYKKCRDIGANTHEELIKVLNELQSAMKTYHLYHGESKIAENKLKYIESQKQKIEQHAGKATLSRKFRNFEKQTEKRQSKYKDNKLKALKARNEYLLCLDAANAAINKYYREDLSNLIDCMDCGFHNTLARSIMMHISAEENTIKSMQCCMDRLHSCVNDLDQGADKQNFLELSHHAFMLPKKFEFQAHKGDEVCQISAQKQVQDELVDRLQSLNERLKDLRLENDEVWKTLKTAETSLMDMINQKDYDVSAKFQDDNQPPKSPHEYVKKRSDRLETEAYYITKFSEYLINNNLITRLEAKHQALLKALGETGNMGTLQRPPSLPPKSNKSRKIGKIPHSGHPKLFGGSIEEYVEATGKEIPPVVKSCIRIINLYGMHHQGVFRISGSHHEINEFKNLFEKGIDPLEDIQDGKDINSIAGVLKLYFRELKEPLFPTQLFDAFIRSTELTNSAECLTRIKELISSLPRPIFVVMRYLFAFLNHLSEYSDENMMDPYNLAICFGPTLLRTPPDKDQVQYQAQVNEVIKNIIIHQEEIFPNDGGEVYEKCIVGEDGDHDDALDNISDDNDDDDDARDAASEDEQEILEALAQYDFKGRTDRELSFKKGDVLVVFQRKSDDWWEGALNGKEGLIPDKYVLIKKYHPRDRDDDDDDADEDDDDDDHDLISSDDKRKSTESLPARPFGGASSSSSSSSEDLLDKSASQPNIAIPSSVLCPPNVANVMTQSTTSVSTNQSTSSSNTLTSETTSLDSSETGDLILQKFDKSCLSESLKTDSDSQQADSKVINSSPARGQPSIKSNKTEPRQHELMEKSTDDLNQDIDSALAEIMSEVEMLELQTMDKGVDKHPAPAASHPKHTPDLVLDLPVTTEKQTRGDPDSPTMSTAEVFAKSNQSTIKKGQSLVGSSKLGNVVHMEASGGHQGTRSADDDIMVKSAGPMTSFGQVTFKSSQSQPTNTQKSMTIGTVRNLSERYCNPTSETKQGNLVQGLGRSSTLPSRSHVEPAGTLKHRHAQERPATPERSILQAIPKPFVAELESVVSSSSSRGPTPDRMTEKPKPPIKAKPPLMRKPGKSPEVLRRLREHQEALSQTPNAPP